MNFKNNSRIFSFALALLILAPAYGQQKPDSKDTAKRILKRAATVSKRSIKETAEKFNLTNRDLIQGALMGSALLGASFFANDPKLKWMLGIAAVMPMLVGVFAPKKLIQKVSKLELDEASCSNPTCKGVCASCRITKSYFATIPLTLISYGIAWMFTKRAVAPIVQPVVANPGTPVEVPAAPLVANPGLPTRLAMPGTPVPLVVPNPVAEPVEVQQPQEQNNPAPQNPDAAQVEEQVPAQEQAHAEQQQVLVGHPLYVRAREGENAAANVELQARPAQGELINPIPEAQEQAPLNNVAPTPAVEKVPQAQEEQPAEKSGWGISWLSDKLVELMTPDVDYDYYDNKN